MSLNKAGSVKLEHRNCGNNNICKQEDANQTFVCKVDALDEKIDAINENLTMEVTALRVELEHISKSNMNTKTSLPNEKRFSNKLDQMLEKYQSSFTMHGVAFIIKGKLLESVIWAIFTLGVLALASYMTSNYMSRYFTKDVRTEIRYIDMSGTDWPTISLFSIDDILSNMFMCHNGTKHEYDEITEEGKMVPCNELIQFKATALDAPLKTSSGFVIVNKNGIYVEKGRGKNMHIGIAFKDEQKFEKISIVFDSTSDFQNRKELSFVSQFKFNTELTRGKYDITVEKEVIKRLPSPYKSNCSSEKTLFSDTYTASSCEEECLFHKVYKTCGDVPDVWKKYLRKPAQPDHRQGFPNQVSCISKILDQATNGFVSLDCYCPAACNEVSYKTDVKRLESTDESEWDWEIAVMYSSTRRVTSIKQVPDYTLEDFLGAMGGMVGLCVGASILSVIELIVYSILSIMNKLVKRINKIEQAP